MVISLNFFLSFFQGEAADLPAGGERPDRPGGGELRCAAGRVANKKPTQKKPEKPTKKPTKNVFFGFLKFFFICYENNTNFFL
jgi:hypothetical protein